MATSENLLSVEQLETIKGKIQTDLLKRGFTAKITTFEEKKGAIKLLTEEFQTTPVMFQSLHISDSGSYLELESDAPEGGIDYVWFYLGVNVRYSLFNGGTNGTDLFKIAGKVHNNGFIEIDIK